MGDLLLVRTRITRPQALFIGEFDYGNYLRLQHKVGVGYVRAGQWQIIGYMPIRGLRAYAATVQRKLAQRYSDAGLHGQPLALISAITLGERDALDSDLRQSFAAAGAAHVLACFLMRLGRQFFSFSHVVFNSSLVNKTNTPGPLLVVAAVTTEGACQGELAQLVTDHVLGDVDGDELVTIVNSEGVSNEIGRNHRSARPSLDHRLLSALIHGVNLLLKFHADVRAFF